MKLLYEEFTTKILPMLRAQHREKDKLLKATSAFIDGAEIVDADGNPVMIEAINLESGPADDADGTSDNGGGDGASAGGDTGASGSAAGAASRVKAKAAKVALLDTEPGQRARVTDAVRGDADVGTRTDRKSWTIPATVSRRGLLRHFKGDGADERAYGFGQFFLACIPDNDLSDNARRWCKQQGVTLTKAQGEGINTAGGYLVPPEFSTDIIDLREQYGVFRRNARIEPMASDTKSVPRRTGGLTAYAVGENQAITESEKAWDMVNLVAKKWAVLTRYSSELAEDAIINIGDDLAGEIAYAFANKEDDAGFMGDGTSTYHGIQGVSPKIKALSATFANIAGVEVAAVTGGWTAITMTDFANLMGRLPNFANVLNDVKWYCSQQFYGGVMQRLALAAGGAAPPDYKAGVLQYAFQGFPVEIAQVLPKATATSDVCCLFGNLRLASKFGDRRGMAIKIDASRYLEYDQLAILGTTRFDIVNHDVGNASATASARLAGPILALMTAAT